MEHLLRLSKTHRWTENWRVMTWVTLCSNRKGRIRSYMTKYDQLFVPMRFWKTDQVQLSSFGMCTIISKFASHHFGNSRQKLRESKLITRGAYQKVSGMAFLRLRGQTETFCARVPCSDWQTIQWKRVSKKCSVGHVFNCCAPLIKYNAYFFEICVNQEVSY